MSATTLSPQQRRIALAAAARCPQCGHVKEYKEIAEEMGIELQTVRNHAKVMYEKLHINSREQLELDERGELRVIRPGRA